MHYLLISLLLISQICFAQQSDPSTFLNLETKLTEEQKLKIAGFENFYPLAKNGDLEAKVFLASRVLRNKNLKKMGLELFQEIYDTHGYQIEDQVQKQNLMMSYNDLAISYLRNELFELNPKKAYKILIENTRHGSAFGKLNLNQYLSNQEYLPIDSYSLDHPDLLSLLWLQYDKNKAKQSLADVINELDKAQTLEIFGELEPEQSLFKSCDGSLGKMNELVSKYSEFQNKILADKNNKETVLTQAISYYTELETSLPNKINSYNFSKINIHTFLNIVLKFSDRDANDKNRFNLKYNQELANNYIEVHMDKVPNSLVITRIFEKFELELLCYKKWIMLKPKSNQAAQHLLLGSFQLESQENHANSEKLGFIKWDDGTVYQGGLINGRPVGQGKFTIPNKHQEGDYEIKGQFKDGVLNGEGEYIAGTNLQVYSYIGEFENGLYHGKGHYIDHSDNTIYQGNFINGKFSGKAKYYFQRDLLKPSLVQNYFKNNSNDNLDLNDYIIYEGDFKESIPDGKGVCSTTNFNYDCEFYKRYLIGIDNYSLLPEYITK